MLCPSTKGTGHIRFFCFFCLIPFRFTFSRFLIFSPSELKWHTLANGFWHPVTIACVAGVERGRGRGNLGLPRRLCVYEEGPAFAIMRAISRPFYRRLRF